MLDEILNLIESVSEDLPTYSSLNDYYCLISKNDDQKIELLAFENRTDISLSHTVITQSKVTDILSTLKVNKAMGPV